MRPSLGRGGGSKAEIFSRPRRAPGAGDLTFLNSRAADAEDRILADAEYRILEDAENIGS